VALVATLVLVASTVMARIERIAVRAVLAVPAATDLTALMAP
jgi:hypothetical protein